MDKNFSREGSLLAWSALVLGSIIVLAIRLSAHAAQLEIGAGIAHAQTNGNGTWFQDGFPHTLRLNQPVALIGVTGKFTRHMDWHLDAVSLGRYSSDSQDVLPDANYSATSATHCNGPCNPFAHYMGNGRIWGIQALLSRHTSGAWQLGVEGGPFLYHETWALSVPNWYEPAAPDGLHYNIETRQQRWATGFVLGATLAHGPWTASLSYYSDGAGFPGHTGPWPPLWSSQTVATLTYRFGGVL